MNIVAILGFTSWSASVNRENHTDDRFAQIAMTSPRIDELVVATPYRSAPVVAARKLMGERTPPLPDRPTGRSSLFEPRRLRRHEPKTRDAMLKSAIRYSDRLGEHVKARGIDRPHVICFNPYIAGLAPFEWAKTATYYSMDDYATGKEFAAWVDVFNYSYEGVRRLGRPFAAVAPILLRRIDSPGPTRLIPNGVDDTLWGVDHPVPDWMAELPRPIAIYTGIVDDRLDTRAVRQVAAAIPGGTVLIVGRVTKEGLEASLADVPNVHFAGLHPVSEVPRIVSNADISLLTHHVTDVTRGMSPLKVYEALGAGLPIVATDLEPVRGVSDRIVLVEPDGDYTAATRRALELAAEGDGDRAAFVRANSWHARFDQLLDFVESV